MTDSSDHIWKSVRQALADQFDMSISEEQAACVLARLLLSNILLVNLTEVVRDKDAIARSLAHAENVLRSQAEFIDAKVPK